MKNLKYIILAALMPIGMFMYAQETQKCVNEVSTNPNDEPSISHLNVLPQDNNQPDTRFINKWEWWYKQGQTNVIPINNMGQTSGQFYGSPMDHFNHSSQGGYYSYLSVNVMEVMLPENGWELVSDNRGWYPDQVTASYVEENGADIGEINRLLVEKVEELTLYILELEERVVDVESTNEEDTELQERITRLEKIILEFSK